MRDRTTDNVDQKELAAFFAIRELSSAEKRSFDRSMQSVRAREFVNRRNRKGALLPALGATAFILVIAIFSAVNFGLLAGRHRGIPATAPFATALPTIIPSPQSQSSREVLSGSPPSPRQAMGMAYDQLRNRLVVFGGRSATGLQGDTWTWDGSHWFQMITPVAPTARVRPAMTYDPISNLVVLTGGRDATTTGPGSPPLSDTWTWDGVNWTRLPLASPALLEPVAVYDSRNANIVVYGSNAQGKSETWTWKSGAWTKQSPAASPPARVGMSAAYDGASQRVLMFGGASQSIGELNDTWAWDGATWTRVGFGSAPAAREYGLLAYVPQVHATVLYGGAAAQGATSLGDVWLWNGSNWSELAASVPPSFRSLGAAVFNSFTSTFVVFGGVTGTGSAQTNSNELWSWDGSSWKQAS